MYISIIREYWLKGRMTGGVDLELELVNNRASENYADDNLFIKSFKSIKILLSDQRGEFSGEFSSGFIGSSLVVLSRASRGHTVSISVSAWVSTTLETFQEYLTPIGFPKKSSPFKHFNATEALITELKTT